MTNSGLEKSTSLKKNFSARLPLCYSNTYIMIYVE